MTDFDLDDLRTELEDYASPKKQAELSPRAERIIAGFEEIQRFVEANGRAPAHGEDRDIFEQLYAVRLDRIRELEECRNLVAPLDHQGLLSAAVGQGQKQDDVVDDEELLAELSELGIEARGVTELRHVRSTAEKRASEEIALQETCQDFDRFEPLFEQVQQELDSGARETRAFELKSEIRPGRFFILNGQKTYIADMGEIYTNAQGRTDARMRVIFGNGTESNMLMRSLQRALHKDDAGRRITESMAGPLFTHEQEDGDQSSGTIYVLRSKSDHPVVASNRNVVHKIGVTGGDIRQRIGNAKNDATYLLADVEVVATYDLYNVNRTRLESLLHRIFEPARLELEIKDRFGRPVKPREWFLVPLYAIDNAVEKIRDQTISQYVYDLNQADLRYVGE